MTDASGAIAEQTSYDSFGNATNNLSTRYQFTGREYDNFTNLHYYRARFYDSNLGRFISEDPIGFAGRDINLYGYVWNNPLTFRDPSGKVVPLIAGGILIGGLILASPSTINAPGPGDPIYYPDNPLIVNAAGGAICGAFWTKFGSPLLSRILSGTGDDIIELGISQGPKVTTPITNPVPQLGEFGIPKYYTYTSQGQSFHIAPNAMRHLEELATHGAGNPNYLRLLGQIHQKSLQATIDDVLSRGPIKYNHIYYSGETEIMFSAPRNLLELPAVTHFRQL